jgi:chorismate synthase
MGSNSFGTIFRITTWGESHGKALGVVIDGCPAGIELHDDDVNAALALRSPGRNPYISPRKEPDHGEILSGTFRGKTTGAPICIIIPNHDFDTSKYDPISHLLRPGHANYTYLEKYGVFDYRGGGRSSARETASRVAAGAVAAQFLKTVGIQVGAYIKQVANIHAIIDCMDVAELRALVYQSPVYCPDPQAAEGIMALLEEAKAQGDSYGAIIEFITSPLPVGLGDPIYEKLNANLAKAMMTIPAAKGIELGSGFKACEMKGSEHNDLFVMDDNQIKTKTNYAGGTLGGISDGMPILGRVAFKPTSSISKPQKTLTVSGEEADFLLPAGSRHDPCTALRAVPVIEAMTALVLVDAILLNRCVKL